MTDGACESGNPNDDVIIPCTTYHSLPFRYTNSTTFNESAAVDALISFFDIASDESNYPLYFHCSVGKDRTGLMATFVEGICWRVHV
ncbi:MAG: tyrosine-protein phosphatase [Bacilli bacterium]|nr:tyrosine-protein phosphatase [Bacilli bacterium]